MTNDFVYFPPGFINESPFAAISIRCWFAIDIAIRYRYRSCPAFPIASGDISHYRKSSGVGRIRLICKACRSISD
ncbi:MAG: hypothetical protein BECKG1743E_GA0114224_108573, partial [Candidatus Kentron sp. G]